MKFEIIPTKGILYDKCENIEQLYDNYYYPLLVEFKQLQNNWNELKKYIGEQLQYYSLCEDDYKEFNILDSIEQRMQELEQGKDE